MFNVQMLSEKIDDVVDSRMSVDDFEDWFLSESWGSYDVEPGDLSSSLVAVHHVLQSFERGEIEEDSVPKQLVNAVLPFESGSFAVAFLSHGNVGANDTGGFSSYFQVGSANNNAGVNKVAA